MKIIIIYLLVLMLGTTTNMNEANKTDPGYSLGSVSRYPISLVKKRFLCYCKNNNQCYVKTEIKASICLYVESNDYG